MDTRKTGPAGFEPKGGRPRLEEPRDMMIAEISSEVRLHWRAPEFERFERDRKWYFFAALVLLVIIGYAVYTNGPVMAITFILIGVVGYIYLEKEPRILDFMITEDGVVAGQEIYEFENLKSFWIFYEPGDIKVISLRTDNHLIPYVHIPIDDQDPVKIREMLLEHIPEEKEEPGLVETLDRLLRL